MWLLAMGVRPGETDRPVQHVDVAATAAELLGVKARETAGAPLREILL
jgi:arylsulfatase A-like enzyme